MIMMTMVMIMMFRSCRNSTTGELIDPEQSCGSDDDDDDGYDDDGDDDDNNEVYDDDEKFCISCVCWGLCEAADDDGASDDNGDFLTIILSQ